MPPAYGGDRGARRRLDPAARPARRGVRAGGRRHAAGLPVEPAGPGRRGGAERPRRRAVGARRRVRAAGAGRPGPGGGGGLAQRRPGAGARRAAGARADRHVGRAAAVVRLRRPRASGSWCTTAGAAGRCATAPRSPRPGGGRQRGLSVLRKSVGDAPDHRGGRGAARGGWRSSTRGRWSSWTTAAWSTCCPTTTLEDDDSPGLVAAGLAALSRGDADAATEAYEKLVARWRAVQLLERCN